MPQVGCLGMFCWGAMGRSETYEIGPEIRIQEPERTSVSWFMGNVVLFFRCSIMGLGWSCQLNIFVCGPIVQPSFRVDVRVVDFSLCLSFWWFGNMFCPDKQVYTLHTPSVATWWRWSSSLGSCWHSHKTRTPRIKPSAVATVRRLVLPAASQQRERWNKNAHHPKRLADPKGPTREDVTGTTM